MHEDVKYTDVPGTTFGHEVVVYGLTRCEPCREAKQFLEAKGWAYKYVHLERQPAELRQQIKKDFAKAQSKRPVFPVLEIDGRYYFGFDPQTWERLITDSTAGTG
ncbi:MAG: glutaredoxin family protein [Spirochaetota bacterium]